MRRSAVLRVSLWGLLAGAALVSLQVWVRHAVPYFQGAASDAPRHQTHLLWLVLHIVAASPALLLGPFALWSGLRRRFLTAHAWCGRLYIILGSLGILVGMMLAVTANHRPTPNFSVGLMVLGWFWLVAAGMAWRAIRNRRVDSHREWMIRSYLLTWSFVVCRLPEYEMLAPLLTALGAGGDATVLWVGWVVPLLAAQVWIEWSRGSRVERGRALGA